MQRTAETTMTRDRWIVTVGAAIWVFGTLFGTGLIGGGVSRQGEGLFTDAATLIAPKGPAFTIWSVIYLGLAAYVIWQWLPAASRSRWAARTRIPAAAAIALNGIWLLVVQADLVWLSVLVIFAIAVSVALVLRAAAGLPRESAAADIVVGVTFGLYLGWVCVATCANVASYLVGLGVPVDKAPSVWITVAVLAVVLALALFLIRRAVHPPAQLAIGAAATWGAIWISVGRFTGELRSETVGYAAAVTAGLIVIGAALIAIRAAGPQRGAAG